MQGIFSHFFDARQFKSSCLVQQILDHLQLSLDVGALVGEGLLVDGSREVAGQQPVLHCRQFGTAFLEDASLLATGFGCIGEAFFEGIADPKGQLGIVKSQCIEFGQDRFLQVGSLPSHLRMIVVGMVVGAAIVDVFADAAVE